MPIYETQEHLSEEEIMKQAFEEHQNCKLRKLPIKYSVDYAVCRGRNNNVVHSFVECKRRYALSTETINGNPPAYLLDIHKIKEAQQLWQTYGKPVWLVVKYNDKIGKTPIAGNGIHFKNHIMVVGGRKDRDNQNDIQPSIFLPLSEFEWF